MLYVQILQGRTLALVSLDFQEMDLLVQISMNAHQDLQITAVPTLLVQTLKDHTVASVLLATQGTDTHVMISMNVHLDSLTTAVPMQCAQIH